MTSGYATQVLNGVTSAVVRDGTGWWLEAKILKTAIDPDLPASGTFGVDFCFRDNDNPDGDHYLGQPGLLHDVLVARQSQRERASRTKVPDVWGDASSGDSCG